MIKLIAFFSAIVLLSNCANSSLSTSPKMTLSDLGTRYWQGTYYLSVTEQTFSIQCKVSPEYKTVDDVPVTYKGQGITSLFNNTDDLQKIQNLKQQCFDKSGI